MAADGSRILTGLAEAPAQTAGDTVDRTWRARTNAVRGGLRRSSMHETSEALFMTSGFVYAAAEEAEEAFQDIAGAARKGRFLYSRYGNPTVAAFEDRLRLLEGAEAAKATATGMAAVFGALACQLKTGDRLVASRALFGSCHYVVSQLLPRWGITCDLVEGTDLGAWKQALARPTTVVFLETPSNPMLEVIDLKAVCDMAHKAGAQVIVDNVFATPLIQRPIEFGADVVVYSATKHIDGQGRAVGGAILGRREFIDGPLGDFVKHTGPSLSPFNAWVMLKGLETLELRMAAHARAALTVAQFLEGHGGIERVVYPYLESHPQAALARAQMSSGGSIVTFEIKGGKEAAFRLLNALELVDISNNLGDAKSLITHPATTTHKSVGPEERARLGISDGVVRLSVGLEDEDDLLADLDQALTVAQNG